MFKEELDVQMDLAKKANQINDINADALSAAGDFESNSQNLDDFKPSQVPGEAFVSAAKHNEQVSRIGFKLLVPFCSNLFLYVSFVPF